MHIENQQFACDLYAGASFFSEAFRSTRQTAAHVITGLASCREGIISTCLDGTIRFHPLL